MRNKDGCKQTCNRIDSIRCRKRALWRGECLETRPMDPTFASGHSQHIYHFSSLCTLNCSPIEYYYSRSTQVRSSQLKIIFMKLRPSTSTVRSSHHSHSLRFIPIVFTLGP